MYFNRFTQGAKAAIDLGKNCAKSLGHRVVGTEHLVVGLLREKDGIAARVLKNLGMDVNTFENKLIEIDTNYIKLTKKGLDLANLVWEKFV